MIVSVYKCLDNDALLLRKHNLPTLYTMVGLNEDGSNAIIDQILAFVFDRKQDDKVGTSVNCCP